MASQQVKTINWYLQITSNPVIVVFGLIGNSLVAMVCSRKKFAKQSSRTYYVAASIADSLTLIGCVIDFFL